MSAISELHRLRREYTDRLLTLLAILFVIEIFVFAPLQGEGILYLIAALLAIIGAMSPYPVDVGRQNSNKAQSERRALARPVAFIGICVRSMSLLPQLLPIPERSFVTRAVIQGILSPALR
jgi:hypothetical protein